MSQAVLVAERVKESERSVRLGNGAGLSGADAGKGAGQPTAGNPHFPPYPETRAGAEGRPPTPDR